MKETDLNIKYICDKTLLNEDDELIPIILDMIKESYKSGLCQAEYDNTMGLIEENEKLKLELSGYRQAILSNKEMLGLKEENEKLKKLLEEYKATNKVLSHELTKDIKQDYLTTCCGIPIGDIPKLIDQQKEFIKYLEDEKISPVKGVLNSIRDKNPDYDMFKNKLDNYEEILQKYKEIIEKGDVR